MKPNDSRAKVYAPHVKGKRVAVSFITLGELRFWGYKRQWGKRKWDDLTARLRSAIIVPYDDAVCDVYATLKADMAKVGKVIGSNDLWIAACAVRHSLTLLTNNRSDFEKVPRLAMISESAVIEQLQSQQNFDWNTTASSEPRQPSSQSSSASGEIAPPPAPRRP